MRGFRCIHLTAASTFFVAVILHVGLVFGQATDKARITNGDFTDWTDSGPVGWNLEIGARNGGDQPMSIVRKGEGPSLELSGDAATMAWRSVSQSISIPASETIQLKFQAKAAGVRREGRQYNNCYVGVMLKNANDKIVGRSISTITADQYREESLIVRAPKASATAQVVIFLSKTGQLNVKNLQLTKLEPADSFQLLVDDMNRNYSYFDRKKIDWNQLTEKYRNRAGKSSVDPSDFVDDVSEMLAELKDIHVWINYEGRRISKYTSSYTPNYKYDSMRESLRNLRRRGKLGFAARTYAGFGYINVSSLPNDQKLLKTFVADIESLFDTPGIIVDLRSNGGGSEPVAKALASMFADQQRVYARHKFRSGPAHDDFTEAFAREITPQRGKTYTKPVVCLIGPGCVSSAEGFAAMMKCFPHVTMIGQNTRGASGNPAPITLPNGVDVWYSRWMSLLPDGTPIEDVGIEPDIRVKHEGKGDPTFERAIEHLKKKTK